MMVCVFLSKGIKHGKACVALGRGQFQTRMRRKKNAYFSMEGESESLACMEGLRVHGGAPIVPKGKPLPTLKAWLKR